MSKKLTYIDLFAGAGGLSEGFIRAGFEPVAHVEMDANACNTLKTRLVYHHLTKENKEDVYRRYLLKEITREELYSYASPQQFYSVINAEINNNSLNSIFELIDKQIGKKQVDVIIGGPPCQAYSLVGRSRDPNRMAFDKRNFLFEYYAEFLKRYKPQYFVFENVTGLLTASDYLNRMLDLFQSKTVGYKVQYKVLNSSDFGVLQSRKRVIIIGKLGRNSLDYPEFEKKQQNWTIKPHLFNDLPVLRPGDKPYFIDYTEAANDYLSESVIRNGLPFVTQHIARPHNFRDLQIYRLTIEKWLNNDKRLHYNELPEGLKTHKNEKSFLDRFKIVNPNGLSHTLVAHIAKDGHYYIYPDLNQVRSISVREAARIQSFPDDYYFEGGRTAAFIQIGNAVPPIMAQTIASKIKINI
jgi:DNA (cytosine-5)-methyltransferase 1